MTIYFAGGEMGAFFPSDSGSSEIADTESAFARAKLGCGPDDQYAQSAAFSLPDEFFVHLEATRGGTASSGGEEILLELRNGSIGLVRLITTGDAELQMQYWDGLAFQDAGALVTTSGWPQTIDLYVDGNTATGTMSLYLSGTLRATATVDLSSVTGITNCRSYGVNVTHRHFISQVVASDSSTIGWRVGTVTLNAAGATSQWTGSYTGIDELTYSDADFIYSDTANDVSLFTGTTPTLTGYVVRAVGVYARAKRGASGPSNLQLALRVNGTTYVSSSKALDVGYGAYGNVWETNPDTTADWLIADLASTQFGVKSIT